ncbi:transposase [Pseudomaricurvus alkylphenolicus]|uniref:REP-associated tyrosine transposase n=1 Tax=Pseudomaricurvus alkylphenolicus TaxID=1306991 RepID=UPI0014236A70|nr:transposase [Pseudomaricurvus alkylphenolicus]NIB44474.1 transposase [Pseudomaricurvus alkylphenolicus]
MNQPGVFEPGARYLFTLCTHQRSVVFNEPGHVNLLRRAFRGVMRRRPFRLDAICVLPDHLHCIWQLPAGDRDFPTRWRLVRIYVEKQLNQCGPLWEKELLEQEIADDAEYQQCLDYIHLDPVKHGYSDTPSAWAWSSFRRHVALGIYTMNWRPELDWKPNAENNTDRLTEAVAG